MSDCTAGRQAFAGSPAHHEVVYKVEDRERRVEWE